MPATSRVIPLTRSRPQARGIVTRRRVLQAAEQLFAKHGYEPTSMAMVARRANIGVGTVYHHVPDKRALLLALIDDWAIGNWPAAKARWTLNAFAVLTCAPQ